MEWIYLLAPLVWFAALAGALWYSCRYPIFRKR